MSPLFKELPFQFGTKMPAQLTMHSAMSKFLLLPQFFGLFPLQGVTNKDIGSIQFKWLSFRMLYSVYNIAGGCFMGILCVVRFSLHGLMLDKTATLTFYVCSVGAAVQFINIAQNWKKILREWFTIDIAMRKYGFPPRFTRRCVLTTVILMFLAICEHGLFVLNNINSLGFTKNSSHFSETYFTAAFPHVFKVVGYSHFRAVYSEIANILMTFAWNYMDLFIIMLSTALALRFQQINRRLIGCKVVHEKFWRELREDYNRLSKLCKTVDDHISTLVIISFTNNLCFLCVQLYNSIKPKHGIIEVSYFFYSFGFLLARTIAVTLYAAWVYDESKKPLDVLHSIPSEYYGTEINRFIEQIYASPVGITGGKCFLVTRGLLLQLAGTIVTLELMLLQFGHFFVQEDSQDGIVKDCINLSCI